MNEPENVHYQLELSGPKSEPDYFRCFDEPSSRRLVLELKEKDLLFKENALLHAQVVDLNETIVLYMKLSENAEEALLMADILAASNRELESALSRANNRLCNNRKCRITIAVLTGIVAGGTVFYIWGR